MNDEEKLEDSLELLEIERIGLKHKADNNKVWYVLFPIIIALSSMAFLPHPLIAIFPLVFSAIISYVIYNRTFVSPFKIIKQKFKALLLKEFMKTYFPKVAYHYNPKSVQGKSIIRQAKLMSADIYLEEDVIEGSLRDIVFYLSEVHLLDEYEVERSNGEGTDTRTRTVFEGLLYKISFPDRNFPKSRIQSRAGLLKRLFSNLENNEEYGFSYETEDLESFHNKLEILFPFIRYLQNKQGDVRIHTSGNEIVILLESDIKFLDDPKPSLSESLINEKYYEKMVKQLNSLFFILESFVGELDTLEIEKGLQERVRVMEEMHAI